MSVNKTLAVILVLFLTAPGFAFGKETVKIGLITPLTGDVKTYGESARNAFSASCWRPALAKFRALTMDSRPSCLAITAPPAG